MIYGYLGNVVVIRSCVAVDCDAGFCARIEDYRRNGIF